VFALHVADVGRARIRLHPQQFLEVDRRALGSQFRGALLGRFHQSVLRRRHAPARVVRKNAGHRRQVADVPVDDPEQRDDGGLVGGDGIEIMPTSA
jgi:hypothetical protein